MADFHYPPPSIRNTSPEIGPPERCEDRARAQMALSRALNASRWTVEEAVEVLEAGPKQEEPGTPTPEEILATGGRLARMIAVAMVPQSQPWSRSVSQIVDRTAGILRRRNAALGITPASSRSPG